MKALEGYDATLSTLGLPLNSVPSPWQATVEQDATWLQERNFRPRRVAEPPWTPAQELQLKAAMQGLASGALLKPTEGMRTGYWLSHHVMDRKHSQRSCCRKVHELRRELGTAAAWAGVVDDDDEAAADSDSEEDSDDEKTLPRPLGL